MLRFSTTDAAVFRNVTVILMSAVGQSKASIAHDLGCCMATVDNSTQAAPLLKGLTADQVIADKDDQVLQTVRDQGGQEQRSYDRELYRERNHTERLFGRLKQCRRIATRYDKTARNFLAFIHLAAAMILLA